MYSEVLVKTVCLKIIVLMFMTHLSFFNTCHCFCICDPIDNRNLLQSTH